MFLQSEGGGSPMEQMAMALKLLGMGEERELGREEQEALNAYRMGGLEQAGAKTTSDIELAKAQLQALKDEATARTTEATAKREFEAAQLANEQKKAEMGLVSEVHQGQSYAASKIRSCR